MNMCEMIFLSFLLFFFYLVVNFIAAVLRIPYKVTVLVG